MTQAPDTIAVVVVTYNSDASIGELLTRLTPQLRDDDDLVVFDNASTDRTREVVAGFSRARLVASESNLGFAVAVNDAVAATDSALMLLLNPDAFPADGCLDALRSAAARHPEWGAWQALVVLPGGRQINTDGGRVHYLGFGWSGNWGEPLDPGAMTECPVGFASGAALCVRREAWQAVEGFEPSYFMYGEDLDIALRLRLQGWEVALTPSAVVEHDYEFQKGPRKWFLLERNRWRTVLGAYPLPLLLLLAPALLAFEVALLAVAARGGWLRPKLAANRAALGGLRATLRRRRHVQRQATVSAEAFARSLTSSLDGGFFADSGVPPVALRLQAAYWGVVMAALRRLARRSA